MISLKRGVSIVGLQPQLVLAMMIAEQVYWKYDQTECVITSGCEGKHRVDSLHYDGLALDLRIRDFANSTVVDAVIEELQVRLNGKIGNQYGEYDITLSPHNIHIEYDVKN